MLFPWGFYIQKDLSPNIILPDWAARLDPQKCEKDVKFMFLEVCLAGKAHMKAASLSICSS